MTNATHSGYTQTTNERLDSLYKTYTEADNMAADRDYADEHYNACAEAAHTNYRRALNEANNAKFSPAPVVVTVVKRRIGGNLHTLSYPMRVEKIEGLCDGDIYEQDGEHFEVTGGDHQPINLAAHSLHNAPQVRRRDDMITRW